MRIATVWEIDRIAAHKLLTALGLEPTPERIAATGETMARHREQCMLFAAERIQGHILHQLETEGPQRFVRENEDWAKGFNHAEALLLTSTPADLLEIAPATPRTKGQHLRAMIRRARQD